MPNRQEASAISETKAWFGLEALTQMVERHHGYLEHPETQGPGRAFEVCLPLVPRRSGEGDVSADRKKIAGGSETILLVEDEPYLRRVTASCLRRMGYAVFDTGEGRIALELWDQHKKKIDLLLADLLLPGPETGLDLAGRMSLEKSSLKIIVSSGNSMDRTNFSEEEKRRIFHLQKPYTASDLALFVRDCLDAELST